MWVIHKIRNYIVNGGQNNSILFTSLEFMDCIYFIVASKLFPNGSGLISIWRDNPDALIILPTELRENFLLDDINLTLVDVPTCVVSGGCSIHSQHIWFIIVLRHYNQLTSIEFLVAEVDDLRMTAIMFPKQRDRGSWPCLQCRREQAVCGKVIAFSQRIGLPYRFTSLNICLRQDIGQLIQVPYNHNVSCTGKCQNSRS